MKLVKSYLGYLALIAVVLGAVAGEVGAILSVTHYHYYLAGGFTVMGALFLAAGITWVMR